MTAYHRFVREKKWIDGGRKGLKTLGKQTKIGYEEILQEWAGGGISHCG